MSSDSDQPDVYRRWAWVFVALIATGCVVGIMVPAGLGWDFANFYDAGRRVATGQVANLYDPLSLIGGQPPQGRTGFFGTPISAVLYTPLAGFSAETALILFKIENVLAFGATFGVLLAFYRPFVSANRLAQSRFAALFAFLFLIYQPFWTVFRVGGQTTPTVLLLVTLGLVAHTTGRLWGSAGCVVLAVLIKPALAPAVLFLAGVSGLAYLARTAALLAVVGAVSLLLWGWPVHAAFLDLMLRSSGLVSPWHFNSSLFILIDNLRVYFGPAATTGALRVVFVGLLYALRGAVVLTIVWLAVRSHRERWSVAARRHFDFLLAVVLFLFWSPTVWEHYLSLLFPFLIYMVAARAYFSRQALILVALIFLLSIGQNLILINWLRSGVEFDSLAELVAVALFKSAPLLLTMVLMWRHSAELFHSHAAPAWERYVVRTGRAPA